MTAKSNKPGSRPSQYRYVRVQSSAPPTDAKQLCLARPSYRQPIDPRVDETVINFAWPSRAA
jgi:hypothetical protein